MGSRCIPHLLLALLVVAVPSMLVADDCAPSSINTVSISANSYRSKTGHWISKADVTRRISRGISNKHVAERPLSYNVDIIRQSCDDADIVKATFNIIEPAVHLGGDYTFFPNVGYYKLHSDKLNWEDSRRTCESEGAHLVIVDSKAEEDAIVELMKPYDIDCCVFIGIHDKDKDGKYITVHGDPLDWIGYVRWAAGDPNNYTDPVLAPDGENCGGVYKTGGLVDASCFRKLQFICEKSL